MSLRNSLPPRFVAATQAPEHDPAERLVIAVTGAQLLVSEQAPWQPIDAAVWRFSGIQSSAAAHYLGLFNGKPCFLVTADDPQPISGYRWESLRALMRYLDDEMFELASRAIQISGWDRDHRYCGRCGAETRQHPAERAKSCAPCGLDFYPRLSPCVITLVTRGEFCLLANNSQFPSHMYSTLAGFIEAGETVEQCLQREVAEEVGVKIGAIDYFGSQPWPFPGQLMLGFFAEYTEGDIVPDGVEILQADWFRYDQLPQVPPPTSLAGRLIAEFIRRCQS